MPDQSFGNFLKSESGGSTAAAESFGDFVTAAPKLSDSLPHPDVVDQVTTARARAIAEPATRPGLMDYLRLGGATLGVATDPQNIRQAMQTPTVDVEGMLPKSLGPGVIRGVAETAGGLTSPENLMLMVAMPQGVVGKLVGMGFSAKMITDAAQQVPGFVDAVKAKDWGKARQLATRGLLSTALAAVATKGITNVSRETESQTPAVTRRESFSDFVEKEKPNAQPTVSPSAPQAQPESGPTARVKPARGAKPGPSAGAAGEQAGAKPKPAAPAAVGVTNANAGNPRVAAGEPQGGGKPGGQQPPLPEGNQPGGLRGPGTERSATRVGQPEPGAGNQGAATRRVTGSADIPLNEEGRQHARQLAGRVSPETQVFHAPNARSEETGQTISKNAQPADWLEPWKLGAHEGKPLDSERDAINDRIVNRPDESPGTSAHSGEKGESFNQFSQRVSEGVLDQAAKPGTYLNITSGRALQVIDAMRPDGSIDTKRVVAEKGEFSKPGQLFKRNTGGPAPNVPDAPRPLKKMYGPNWESRPDADALRKAFSQDTYKRSKALKQYREYVERSNAHFRGESGLVPVAKIEGPGQYFAQHGATEWNQSGKAASVQAKPEAPASKPAALAVDQAEVAQHIKDSGFAKYVGLGEATPDAARVISETVEVLRKAYPNAPPLESFSLVSGLGSSGTYASRMIKIGYTAWDENGPIPAGAKERAAAVSTPMPEVAKQRIISSTIHEYGHFLDSLGKRHRPAVEQVWGRIADWDLRENSKLNRLEMVADAFHAYQTGAKLPEAMEPLKRVFEDWQKGIFDHPSTGSERGSFSNKPTDAKTRILDKLDEFGMGVGELREKLGIPKPEFDQAINDLHREGKIHADATDFPQGMTPEQLAHQTVPGEKGKHYVMVGRNPERGAAPLALIDPLGVHKFIEQDVAPTLGSAARTLAESADDVLKVFAPTLRSPQAQAGGGVMRQHLAELARASDQARAALAGAKRYFDKQPAQANYQFIDRMEHGQPQATGQLNALAGVLRRMLDERRVAVQALGTGKLQAFYTDYFPHIWQDPKRAGNIFGQFFGKRPLEGGKSFLKKRTLPTMADGLAAGLKPVSDNPVDMVLLKAREMDRYLMAHHTLNDWKSTNLAKFVRIGGKAPQGWTRISDPIGQVWGRSADDELVLRGSYYAPEGAARVLNNYLSPGLRQFGAYRVLLGANNTLNQFQLGLSAFHLGFTSADAAVSKGALAIEQAIRGKPFAAAKSALTVPIAPFTTFIKGNKVLREWYKSGSQGQEIAAIVDALEKGGGRARMDEIYATHIGEQMAKAFRSGNILGGLVRTPFATVEAVSNAMMKEIVPRQKLGVFADLAKLEMQRLGPGASVEQVRTAMSSVWDSVDNRMGQMVYDNLFWNKFAKDAAMLSVRSVGWNLGTIREIGGAAGDVVKLPFDIAKGRDVNIHRMAYVASLALTSAAMGALYQYLATGKGPQELKDYYFPRTGELDESGRPQRITLPTYVKDVYHYAIEPGRTISNKLAPIWEEFAEMIRNEDFYGTKIRNEDDPLVRQMLDEAKFAAKQMEPFGIRNLERENELQVPMAQRAQGFVGITPAQSALEKTKAERLAGELIRSEIPAGGRTKEAAARSKAEGVIRRLAAEHKPVAEEIRKDLAAGTITKKDVRRALQDAYRNPLEREFSALPIDKALQVWKAATSEEKKKLRPFLARKAKGLEDKPPEEQALYIPKIITELRATQ